MEKALEKVSLWWNDRYKSRPLLNAAVAKKEIQSVNLNRFWTTADSEPDFEGLVNAQIENMSNLTFLAEAYPVIGHSWGGRGTPMTMAAYLGGKVNFAESTVWIDPVIDDWRKFEIRFDENNYWVRQSKKLMECQLKKSSGNFLVVMPDLGDALTVFSMLRGVEKLLMDIIEIPDVIKEKTSDFVKAWTDAHRFFHSLYKKVLPGDCSWLLWAPGKTYACQCDFSTMISPAMFEEFVVPEIEELGKYLDYIIWHLDGPEEIKHLDTLLGLPEIKAIQVVPGAGRPPCTSPLWMPQMKKIQEKGKLVYAYAETEEELKTLAKGLLPEKLFIGCGGIFSSPEAVEEFFSRV